MPKSTKESKKTLSGIILAGGKSRRMGKEKPLIEINGKSLIQTTIDLLTPFCSEIIISANSSIYNRFNKKVISDEIPDCGPVGGIHSALKQSTSKLNLIIASDTPYINRETIEYLISNADENKISAIVLSNGHIESLCAIYPTNIIKEIEKFIANGEYKLVNILRELDYKPVLIDESKIFYNENLFKNLNSPEDLKNLLN